MITASLKAEGGCIFPVTDVAHVRQAGKLTQGPECRRLVLSHYGYYSQILTLMTNQHPHQQVRFRVMLKRAYL